MDSRIDFLQSIDESLPSDRNDLQLMKVYILNLCQKYLHGVWELVDLKDFTIYKPNGGVSNYLYKCEITNKNLKPIQNEPTKAFVRIYNEYHHKNVNFMINDIIVTTMISNYQLGPKLYGIFPSGRIEELIDAEPLNPKEMYNLDISCKIAKTLADFHSLEMPFAKKPSCLFDKIKSNIENAKKFTFTNKYDIEVYNKIMGYDLLDELQDLMKIVSSMKSLVVFCHNDCNVGNILNHRNNLLIIDYEYSSYNYRGYDIANHFCEWMFNLCENDEDPYYFYNFDQYPDKSEQERFIEAYLKKFKENNAIKPLDSDVLDKDQLLDEVYHFTLVNSIYWTFWSFCAWNPTIKFNYFKYAEDRCDAYFKHKKVRYPNGYFQKD